MSHLLPENEKPDPICVLRIGNGYITSEKPLRRYLTLRPGASRAGLRGGMDLHQKRSYRRRVEADRRFLWKNFGGDDYPLETAFPRNWKYTIEIH